MWGTRSQLVELGLGYLAGMGGMSSGMNYNLNDGLEWTSSSWRGASQCSLFPVLVLLGQDLMLVFG